ncbi:MAG: nucleotide exchange factor GrpE [Clostridia bacterium]|nr:nucleotide exchange factor GrpE [Clostridia bacterium]
MANKDKKIKANQQEETAQEGVTWDISNVPDGELREFAESVINSLKEENQQLLAEHKELKKQIAKGDEYLNQLVVLKNDFENYRRRTTASTESAKADGKMEVVEKMFPILDTFDKARQMLSKEEMATFNLVAKQFEKILENVGVNKMQVVGLPFDPNTSSAVYKQPVNDKEQDNIVMEEYASGYSYGEKILRYATVSVGVFEEKQEENQNLN